MSEKEYRQFDFRDIATLDDTAKAFRDWVSKASSFFGQFWSQVSDYGTQLSLGAISTESYAKTLEDVPRDNHYCVTEIEDHVSSIWFTTTRDFQLIVGQLLGLASSQQTESDENGAAVELTQIELSLVQLFVENLANSFKEGWLGNDEISVKVTGIERDPRKVRLCRAKDLVTRTSVQIEFKDGTANLNWLLPKQKTCNLFETATGMRAPSEPRRPSPQKIGQLPIELVSVLGQANIPMGRLSEFSVGQLIKLDQRIDQPVVTYVNNTPLYECWPGKLGNKQALEISSCLNE